MRLDSIEAFKARLLAVRWDESMPCPVTAPTPKHRKIHTIPLEVRAKLACVMQERRRSNVRINYQSPLYSKLSDVARKELNSLDTTAPEEYFRLSVEIDSVYEQVLGRLGQEVRASRGAIIELHENWTFSQTTHRHIQRTYAAKKKHRGKEAPALSKGGPVLDYRDMYPTEQCGLQRYYRAHMLQDATLEGYLARARESNRNARNALTAERG